MNTKISTYYAPAERSTTKQLNKEINLVDSSEVIRSLMEGIPDLILVLNKKREIIAVNKKASLIFFDKKAEEVLGIRLGEALNCQYSNVMDGGCGTSQHCSVCGAVQAMEKTRKTSTASEEECRITREVNGRKISVDLKVSSKILMLEGEEFILFHVKDISNEKRREVLEKIFFHDILNTGSAIKGLAEILPTIDDSSEIQEIEEALISSSDQLISEIQMQRELTLAEQDKLNLKFELCSVNEILNNTERLFKNNEVALNKKLLVNYPDKEIMLILDKSAIIRCLVNLTKNAFEASTYGQTVEILCKKGNGNILFEVKNETIIPHNIQLQIFQRSFSTKGERGRGIGTYSVKLLIEKYLEGKVKFLSNKEDKTIFTITIPEKYEFTEGI